MIRRADQHRFDSASAVYPALVRYGAVPQVARFAVADELLKGVGLPQRGDQVVVESDRGLELGTLLHFDPKADSSEAAVTGSLVRIAADKDFEVWQAARQKSADDFRNWQDRIEKWKLQLQLIDLEMTLDGQRTILYVLNSQNAETTRLALLAAASGLGIIHVQPVGSEGVLPPKESGGCGSGGCGSGGCGH
ncbi:MAG: hypothetical protein R3C49_08300 [Planctomycetaceae bacterium]